MESINMYNIYIGLYNRNIKNLLKYIEDVFVICNVKLIGEKFFLFNRLKFKNNWYLDSLVKKPIINLSENFSWKLKKLWGSCILTGTLRYGTDFYYFSINPRPKKRVKHYHSADIGKTTSWEKVSVAKRENGRTSDARWNNFSN